MPSRIHPELDRNADGELGSLTEKNERIRHALDAPRCPRRWKKDDLRDSCRPAGRDSKGEFVANPGLTPWALRLSPRQAGLGNLSSANASRPLFAGQTTHHLPVDPTVKQPRRRGFSATRDAWELRGLLPKQKTTIPGP